MTDAEMLSRITDGDTSAFESFYDQTSPTLFAVLLRVLENGEAAEEVLQDSFGQVWRTASSFNPERGSAIGWLISIGRSRAFDRIRSEGRRRKREHEAAAEDARFSPNGDQMSGFRHASIMELRKAVRVALSEIPDEQQKAIELAYYKGMTQAEIARDLGQPLGTVKTRILLGMRKLRSRLADFHPKPRARETYR